MYVHFFHLIKIQCLEVWRWRRDDRGPLPRLPPARDSPNQGIAKIIFKNTFSHIYILYIKVSVKNIKLVAETESLR